MTEHEMREAADCAQVLENADEIRGQVVRKYRELLNAAGSSFFTEETMQKQLLRQAAIVVDEVLVSHSTGTSPPGQVAFSAEIGSDRARGSVHPTHSLNAATLMFEAAYPVLLRALDDGTGRHDTALSTALNLHRSIMLRLAVGSVPYVNFLLAKLLSAHQDERQRVARDLHDRVAHGMGAALQQIDLYEIYLHDDPDRAAHSLAQARRSIHDGLDGARRLSADLWERVGEDGLPAALDRYLRATVPRSIRTALTVDGDLPKLGWEVQEELYILIREAIRNALLHAGTSELRVVLAVGPDVLRASVIDRGCGFDVAEARSRKCGGGLKSITERAELLGGTAVFHSRLGEGTEVKVLMPLFGDSVRVGGEDADR